MHLMFTDGVLRNAFESDVWDSSLPADARADISNILDELAIIVKGNATHNLGCIRCKFEGSNVSVTFLAYAS